MMNRKTHTMLFLLFLLKNSQAIEIPDAVLALDQYGIVIEPESIMLSYENNIYTTIAIDMDLVANPTKVPEFSSKTDCTLTESKKKLLEAMNHEMQEFLETIPSRFNPLSNHICRGTKIDCLLMSNNGETDISRALPHRHKRQVFLTVAAVAGLASAGVGLYNFFNDKMANQHLQSVEEEVDRINEKVSNAQNEQLQYHKISKDVFLKLAFGLRNLKENMRKDICEVALKFNKQLDYVVYSLVLEDFKMKFNAALDGQVTDFLVTSSFLRKTLLNKPEFDNSVH
ncbi:hypothetical protein J6590_087861 [Homalodisca vitripennis]|nr:hypothetical protein J6590_087861 [Homalodisca vitripennis]